MPYNQIQFKQLDSAALAAYIASGIPLTGVMLIANNLSDVASTSASRTNLGLGNVENTALSTWAGTTNITTLGTIATGTWAGTTIAVNKGGTGLTAGTSGGVLAFTATGTLASSALLATNTIVVGGGAGAAPLTQPTTPPTISSTGILAVVNATAASSTTTGALTVTGGISTQNNLWASGTINAGDNITATKNTNATFGITLTNTSASGAANAGYNAYNSGGYCVFLKQSSGYSGYKIFAANDCGFYNNTNAGNIAILNDCASGSITMSAGGSSTAQWTLTSTGAVTQTGSLTVGGAVIGGVQTLSGAGAVNVTTLTTALTSTGVLDALTLANGTNGQIKTIIHDVDGGSAILTPTTKTGFSTITFTNAGDTATLQYLTTRGWFILDLNGATAAP